MKSKIKTTKEIMDFEVGLVKELVEMNGEVFQQFNIWTDDGVIPTMMVGLDKDETSEVLEGTLKNIKSEIKVKPYAVTMMAEAWVSKVDPKDKERAKKALSGKLLPSQDPERESIVTVTIWTKDKKETRMFRMTENKELIEDKQLKGATWQSRWDFVQKLLVEAK